MGPCCVHPRHLVLHFEWVNVPGHVVTNDETSSPPLCWSCSLLPNMHLPNYYETGWINLLNVESSPSKYWPVSIYQVGITSVYFYKIVILMILNTNIYLMILHKNFEMFDDFTHKYCIHLQRLSVLTEYLSLLLIILFRSLGPFLFKRKLVYTMGILNMMNEHIFTLKDYLEQINRGGITQLVSCPPLKLGTWVRIPVGAWLVTLNAWMRGEEITSCKSHIASVSLTDWRIMIFSRFFFFNEHIKTYISIIGPAWDSCSSAVSRVSQCITL